MRRVETVQSVRIRNSAVGPARGSRLTFSRKKLHISLTKMVRSYNSTAVCGICSLPAGSAVPVTLSRVKGLGQRLTGAPAISDPAACSTSHVVSNNLS